MERFIAALLLISSLCVAQDATPYDLKGDRLGMDLADFTAKYHHVARGDNRPLPFCQKNGDSLTDCQIYAPFEKSPYRGRDQVQETIANVPADLYFSFVEGKLYLIAAVFKQSDFETVLVTFKEKYGEPQTKESSVVQNGFGATFQRIKYIWNNGASFIQLDENGPQIDRSKVIFGHVSLGKLAVERQPKHKPDI